VTLSVQAGTSLGIVGESGCGKTTLARCVLGLERPTAGTVRVDGLAVGSRAARRSRSRVQPVFQNPASSLNPRRRVQDIVAEPIRTTGLLPRRQLGAEVSRLLGLVGLPAEYARAYPRSLSGGERQRVSIARAIAARPRLLVADEATSSLDVLVQSQVLELLLDLRRQLGLTMLFVSHNLAATRRICDSIAVMYAGEVVEYGPAREVLDQPQHPYTQALVSSMPRIGGGGPASEELVTRTLLGEVPSPFALPPACRFEARCPSALARCSGERPERWPGPDGGRWARCHLLEPPGTAAPAGQP
jgi:oligopeptide/dipeptide ABC transporter ATP-binding protein